MVSEARGRWSRAVGGKARLGVGFRASKTDCPRLPGSLPAALGVHPTSEPEPGKAEVWVLLACGQRLLSCHAHRWTPLLSWLVG